MNNDKKTRDDLPSQEELLKFLLTKHSYPHKPKHIRFVQTHASYVFIVPPFVYKIKKPVNFGFLDFSTLEKRRFFCQQEIQLNRLLCPDAYLGVIPIFRNPSGFLSFDGSGTAVEYAVQMRMLPHRYFFKRLLLRNCVQRGDIDRLVSKLCQFYKETEDGADIASWGTIEKIKKNTDENFEQTQSVINIILSRTAFESIRYFTNRFYELYADLFEERVKQGWIKNCHGDLHLEHIHLQPKNICIFDRIEFNERFRFIDVASDIAFLAMDLDYNGRQDLSCFFSDSMGQELKDVGLKKLLDFYKSYRAYVRGKVEGMTAQDPLVDPVKKKEHIEKAKKYFRLSLQYAAIGSKPMLLVVMGKIATGKSYLAQSLAEELDWKVFSSDRIRKEMLGLDIYTRPEESIREKLYSEEITSKTYERLIHNGLAELCQNKGVVLDATFGRKEQRALLLEALHSKGYSPLFIEVQADLPTRKKRLVERRLYPSISDARLEDLTLIDSLYEEPKELPQGHLLKISSTEPLMLLLSRLFHLLCDLHLQRLMQG